MSLDRARLAAALGDRVEVHDALASTQERAKAAAREGAPHGFVVFAERQDAGRGRQGRVWESGSGAGLLLTVVLRPALRAQDAPRLCLAAAVGVVEATGDRYGIKWPNDVLAPDGRKVAGILAECEPVAGGGIAYALLGVGLNVHGAPPLPTATCLDAVEGGTRDRTALATALVLEVRAWSDRLVTEPDVVLERWRQRQVTLGRRVRIGGIEGTAMALEPSGALTVRDDGGAVHLVTTGDVEMIGRL